MSENKIKIQITQYQRPYGRPVTYSHSIPEHYKDKITLLKRNDCQITCEQLSTGEAAQYITHKDGFDILVRITPCGKPADVALLEMLDEISQEIIDIAIKSEYK
jgi:hypothetical protein